MTTAASATSKATFRDVAHAGRELGLPVFPCDHKKHPLVKWGEFQRRLPTEAEIDSWSVDANPALATGEFAGVDVLDFDPGHEPWPLHPYELPADVVVKTPRGGAHYYIKHVPGAHNSASALARNVDARAEGGYVLLPGGPLPYTYEVGSLAEIAALRDGPDVAPWLAVALLNGGAKSKAAAPKGDAKKLREGARNVGLTKLAGKLRRAGLDAAELEAALLAANAARCDPPLPASEAKGIAKSVGRYDAEGEVERPRTAPVVVCMADVEPQPIDWLWEDWIPSRSQTVPAGVAALGKSSVALDLAARISRGLPWPDGKKGDGEPGDTLILSGEDSTSMTIRPMLDAMDADVARVSILTGVQRRGPDGEPSLDLPHLVQDLPAIEAALGQLAKPKLLIVDPISCYLLGVDTHREASVRSALMPLAALAERCNIAILTIMHFRKDGGGAGLARISGSGAFGNAARSVAIMLSDQNDDDVRIVGITKANLGRKPPGLSFTLAVPPGHAVAIPAWGTEPLARSVDDVLAAGDEPPDRECDDAAAWLRELLANGPMPFPKVESEAEAAGYTMPTVRRAKARIGARSDKPKGEGTKGAPWNWELP